MIRGVSAFKGERLEQARLARGMNKTTLGTIANISKQMITAYENGTSKPREDNLEILSTVLNFPTDFFLKHMNPERVDGVFWRAQVTDTQRSQDKTSQRIAWARDGFEILSEFLKFPNLDIPKPFLPDNWKLIDDEDIENAAEYCRNEWGLGNHPIPDMILAVENMGIPVLSLEIENAKQSGFMFPSESLGRPIVGSNSLNLSVARQRFNIAHELGHVILHKTVEKSELKSRQSHKAIEEQANRFAGALLFPRDAFLRHIRFPSIEEFTLHKREWGVSIAVQIYRAAQLDICSKDVLDHLNRSASKKGYRRPKGEPFDEAPLEKPRMLRRAIDALDSESEMLLHSVRDALRLPLAEEVAIFGRNLGANTDNIIRLWES